MRVLWLTNIPSPYRVDFFNELGKSCELTVLFEKTDSTERDAAWRDYEFTHFCGVFMRGIPYSTDSAFCPEVVLHLGREHYDRIVVTNFSSLTGALAVAYLKAARRAYYLESDGGFPSGGRLKSWLKRAVIARAEGYFSTSDVHDAYYLAYGARSDQLIRYPFTSVHAHEVLRQPPSTDERGMAKRTLGITQPQMVLSIGQFIHRKGFDVLLRASSLLGDDVGIVIVGGSPAAEFSQLVRDLKLTNVYFEGFKSKNELVLYFEAADIFVLPTREDIWGLVINEALAHALPVVSTERCVAGLELVAKNKCGRIVPVGDVDALASATQFILHDDKLRFSMASRALDVGGWYTIERMAERHMEAFLQGVDRSAD